MAKKIEFEGQIHEFPDDASEEEISSLLHSMSSPNNSMHEAIQSKGFLTRENREPTSEELKHTLGLAASIGSSFIPGLGVAGKLFKSPVGKYAANLVSDVLQNAGIGAGVSAISGESPTQGALLGGGATAAVNPLLSAVQSNNPWLKIGAGATLGLGAGTLANKAMGTDSNIPDVAGSLLGAGLALHGKTAKDLAASKIFKGVNLEEAKPRLEAAERLGLTHLTPAEATGNPYVGKAQGNTGNTDIGSQILMKKQAERVGSEKRAINNLLETIYKREELDPIKNEFYNKAYKNNLEDSILSKIEKSKTVKSAMSNVEKNPAFQDELENVPKNNFEYLDLVKRQLDDMQGDALSKTGRVTNESRLIGKQRDKLVKEMDKISPDYQAARQIAERDLARKRIEDKLNEKEIRGSYFYNKILKNDKNREKLLLNLRNVPEAQQQLRDMHLSFEHLINPKTPRSTSSLEETSMTKPRSTTQGAQNWLNELVGKKYDIEKVNLMTHPNWHEIMKNTPKSNLNDERLRKIRNAISRQIGITGNTLLGGS
jgi:hypothetical protein